MIQSQSASPEQVRGMLNFSSQNEGSLVTFDSSVIDHNGVVASCSSSLVFEIIESVVVAGSRLDIAGMLRHLFGAMHSPFRHGVSQ